MKYPTKNIALAALLYLLPCTLLFAQKVTIVADRYKIFIGEQVRLKLTVEGVWPGVPWLYIPDSVNHFEVVERGKIDTVKKGGSVNYYQSITITSFDSGTWKFPSLVLPGVNKTTIPFNIAVLPVDVSGLKDYHDIKDIILVKPGTNWLLIIIIAAALILLGIMVWWYLKKRKKTLPAKIIDPGKPPLDWAMEELDKLKKYPTDSVPAMKVYFSRLTEIGRTFFSRQFQQQSFNQTTDEWMVDLQALAIDNETRTGYFQVLRLADAVKFAKYMPSQMEAVSAIDVSKQLLQKAALLPSSVHSKYQPG